MAAKKRKFKDVRMGTARVLAGLRSEKNLTQREAARRLGRSHGWVSMVETGQHKVGVQDLVELCEIYGADVEETVRRIMRWQP
jgi:transcriptional regulator with XRE-family HTH domain